MKQIGIGFLRSIGWAGGCAFLFIAVMFVIIGMPLLFGQCAGPQLP